MYMLAWDYGLAETLCRPTETQPMATGPEMPAVKRSGGRFLAGYRLPAEDFRTTNREP